MTLYLQDPFCWEKRHALQDEAGRVRYSLTGDAYAMGRRLHIWDLADREAVSIRQQVPALFPTFDLEVYGKPVGIIRKDLRLQPPRLILEGLDWELLGAPAGRDFTLLHHGAVIAACGPARSHHGYLALTLPPTDGTLAALGVLTAAVVLT